MSDDFYVGYEPRMPKVLGYFVGTLVATLLLGVVALAVFVPALHREAASARSDFRDIREFDGIIVADPVPHLALPRPNDDGFSRYLLVGRGKSGPKIDLAALDRQYARVRGSLIYRGAQTLISVKSAEPLSEPTSTLVQDALQREEIGTRTLQGEIIDSKCYFGTMRPGETKVHRGCAVRCISGGVPPMLLVRDENGNGLSFLLVDTDGSAVNDRVLDIVAEPVEITGEVERLGDVWVLKADPTTYRRL